MKQPFEFCPLRSTYASPKRVAAVVISTQDTGPAARVLCRVKATSLRRWIEEIASKLLQIVGHRIFRIGRKLFLEHIYKSHRVVEPSGPLVRLVWVGGM
jgi:hypothetical protein